jgi:hypothetical protein
MPDPRPVPSASRPLLLGYVRIGVLSGSAALPRAVAALETFVERENFTLGPVFMDTDRATGGLHALLDELARNDHVRGVVIPSRRHLTCDEQVMLSRHEHAARAPVLVVEQVP